MKTKPTRQRRLAAFRRKGTLPPGAVQLGCERLEERAFLAADVALFQNPANQFDPNNDGFVNRFDVFALVSEFRSGGERSLLVEVTETGGGAGNGPGSGNGLLAEGEAPSANSNGIFFDIDGDNDFDRGDVFSLIGRLRAEGEQNPTGVPEPVIMRYTIGIFRDLGGGNVVQLTDPDGPGPLGVAVPQNTNFLVRVFVEDTGAQNSGQELRNPNELGIGQFALDLSYRDTVNDANGVDTGAITLVGAAAPAKFEGPENPSVPAVHTDFDTPAGPFTPVYDDLQPPEAGENNGVNFIIHDISGSSRESTLAGNFLGTDPVLAFEVQFTAGVTGNINGQPPHVTFATQDFRTKVGGLFFNSTQDGKVPNFPNSQVDDDTLVISIVDDTEANRDLVVLHELATAATATPDPLPPNVIQVIAPSLAEPNGVIQIDVTQNDFVPPGSFAGVESVTQPAAGEGTAAVNNNGTPADPTDDFVDYRPPSQFFITPAPITFTYTMRVQTPGGGVFTPGASRTGTVAIDLREFNFDPVVSAPGVDEVFLGGSAATGVPVTQGATATFFGSNINHPGAADDILDNDFPGNILDDTQNPGDENRPNQRIHINGDPGPGNTFPIDPARLPQVLVNGVVSNIAGTVKVTNFGDLEYVASPSFLPGPGEQVSIRYFVGDNGTQQSLDPNDRTFSTSPLKFTQQELKISIIDVTDLAEISVDFFEDNAGVVGADLNGEVDAGASFFAIVSIDVTAAGAAGGITGIRDAFADLLFDQALVGSFTAGVGGINVVDVTVLPPFAPGFKSVVSPNLVDDTGGTNIVNANVNVQQLFQVRMRAVAAPPLLVSTDTDFTPFFVTRGPGGNPGAVGVNVNRGAAVATLTEAAIAFVPGRLTIAIGEKPIADDDAYVTNEDTTLTVSDLDPPTRYTGEEPLPAPGPGPGVLANDSDADFASAGNFIKAELVSTAGIANGTLFLEDATGAFIPVTGAGAQPAPANWNGGFQFIPTPGFFHAAGASDNFTYRVVDRDQRRSDVATVRIVVGSVDDAPVGVADRYEVGANPNVLTVGSIGNDTGNGAPAAEPPDRGVLNNDTDGDLGTVLTAELLSLPTLGTLELEDPNNPGTFIPINVVGDQPAGWKGTFRYTPNAGVRGIVDTFTYRAVDATGLFSAATEVNIEIDLANITIAGQLYVDDSNVDRAGQASTGTGGNGRFGFDDVNLNNTWEAPERNIERTLGGVSLGLAGNAIVNGAPIVTGGSTNSAGRFAIVESAPGVPIPAGNYTLTTDARLDDFFSDPLVGKQLDISATTTDAFFGMTGLRTKFIDFNDLLVSTLRDGVHIGFDPAAVGGDPIVWYAIDRGPGWNVFAHEITDLTFAGGRATLTFTEPTAVVGVVNTFKVAVPMSNGTHYSEVFDAATGLKVVHIRGTADALKAKFLVP